MGGVKSKIDEQTLITYLEQMNEGEKTTPSIKVSLNKLINPFSSRGRSKMMKMTSDFKFLKLI
jgi:hypothetical protein